MTSAAPRPEKSPVGQLLHYWRGVRNMSQLSLSLEADVSARHVSFIETGRSRPSREMVLTLASALEIPLRERNDLLLAAGYAAQYRESDLESDEMAPARRALDCILDQQEPLPAVVMDRHWNLLRGNRGAERLFSRFVDLEAIEQPANVLRLMFDPDAVRPHIANWDEVAPMLLQRVRREAVGGVPDEATRQLLEEILGYPGVPGCWRTPDPSRPLVPFVPVEFDTADGRLRFFSAVTTLGTAQDITLQEIRIESFFAADQATAQHFGVR